MIVIAILMIMMDGVCLSSSFIQSRVGRYLLGWYFCSWHLHIDAYEDTFLCRQIFGNNNDREQIFYNSLEGEEADALKLRHEGIL